MRKREVTSLSYSWWVPSFFVIGTILLLMTGVFRNTLFNPYEQGYREDIGHLEHVDTLIEIGALRVSKEGKVMVEESALLDYARKTYSFGKSFSWLEEHPGSLQFSEGEVALKSSMSAEHEKQVPALEKIHFLKRKGLISFDSEGNLVFHYDVFSERVMNTALGRHYRIAKNNLNRFSWSEQDGIVLDHFYFREVNTFSVERRIPKGRIFDRNDLPLTNWDRGRRVHQENNAGTFHVVGFSNLFGLEKYMKKTLNGKRDLGVHSLLGLQGNDRCGNDIRLSIDAPLSQELYNAFERKGKQLHGAVVLLEIETGRIIASVSSPSLDLGKLGKRPDFADLQELEEKPLLNRAWDEIFFPGSTYKTVVAATMLLYPDLHDETYDTLTDPNKKVKDEKSFLRIRNHAGSVAPVRINMYLAFAVSSNTYFARQGVALGQRVEEMAEKFQFNHEMDVLSNIEGTSWTTAEPSAYKGPPFQFEKKGDHRLVAQFSIGQNQIKSHPLHMASLVATVANDGVFVEPTLVSHYRKGVNVTKGENHKSFREMDKGEEKRILEKGHARAIQKAMGLVMNHKLGTGYRSHQIYKKENKDGTMLFYSKYRNSKRNDSLVKMAGKTGTAENTGKRAHAWFIGFAPIKKPKLAVAVIVENTGYGSVYAEPIAAKALAGGLNILEEKK